MASDKRSPFFPDVPTYADLGIANASLDIWFGVWAPNHTPPDVLARLSRELNKALAQPALKQHFADLGAEPAPLEQAEFRRLLGDEGRTLAALIKDRRITME